MRVTSALFVSALVRRAMVGGAFAAVTRRGASEAGAIFVVARLGSEERFDPDLYVVEIEDKAARPFLEVVEG